MIPKWSNDERVPEVNDYQATVVEQSSKPSLFSRMFTKKNKTPEEMYEEAEMIHKVVEPVAEEIEEIDEEIEELEQKRENLLTRFFSFLFGSSSSNVDDEIDQSQIDAAVGIKSDERLDETRAVLKLTHKWISRLPPEHLAAFRNSPDFERYKDCLDNYGLIKK